MNKNIHLVPHRTNYFFVKNEQKSLLKKRIKILCFSEIPTVATDVADRRER